MNDHPSSAAILSPSPSPTLSIYSSRRLNDIASRVIHQLRLHHDDDPFPFLHTGDDGNPGDAHEDEEEEEFTFVCQPQYASPTPADQIFCDGRIRTAYTYPVSGVEPGDGKKQRGLRRETLGKFLMEERESSSTSYSSSSEGEEEEEEIEGAEPGSYCVWRPPEGVKVKVKETRRGKSRRWRFRDYFVLKRSTSEGQKDKFVILWKGRGDGGQY